MTRVMRTRAELNEGTVSGVPVAVVMTMGALHAKGTTMLPYFALVMLVAAIIPACRRFERRWNQLSDVQAANPEFAPFIQRIKDAKPLL